MAKTSKDNSLTIYCNIIVRWSMYALVFLIPLIFAPWTYDVGDFNKQAVVILLSCIGLTAWMLKSLMVGKFSFKLHKVHLAVLVLGLTGLLSTLFSVWPAVSFWGVGQFASQAFVSLLAFLVIYFLISNTFSPKEIVVALRVLGVSGVVAILWGIAQIMGWYVAFNSIGSFGDFGFFIAIILPLFLVLSIISKKWWRLFFLAAIALAFIALLLVNYYFIWLICLVGSVAVIMLGAWRRDVFDVRWMCVPIFFAVVALFFILFNPQIAWLPKSPQEISLSNQSTLQINLQSLKSFGAVGSGPGTFSYDFSKYKSKDINQTSLWNVNFNAGASKILTTVSEAGILGLLAFLAVMALALFYGAKYVWNRKTTQESLAVYLAVGLWSGIISLAAGYFLHNGNVALDFTYFFMIALLTALIFKNSNTYALKSSSLMTIAVIAVFVVVFIFEIGIVFLGAQRYIANMNYQKGIALFGKNKKDESLVYLKKAAASNASDTYFNQLSLFSLVALQNQATTANTQDPKVKQVIQNLINDAVAASNSAVTFNVKNFENWSTRGYLCQNLIGLFPSAPDCAIQSYEKAIELNPFNPYLLFQLGATYYQNKDWDKAQEYFQRVVDVAPEYAKQQQIQKIMDNIKSAKSAKK